MPRNIYTTKIRDAFVKAAQKARAQGKSWVEAFEVAKAAGYAGSLQGISKIVRDVEEGKPAKKPGRPKKTATAPVQAAASSAGVGMDSLQKAINGLVEQRVRAALDRAIAELKKISEPIG